MFHLDIVATRSYYVSMEHIKTVGVKNLKNNLSAYLREVRSGRRVLITDRDEVVAELREPTMTDIPTTGGTLRERWIHDGLVRPALAAKTPCPPSPIKSPSGTSQRLIDEDRGE